MAFCLLRLHSQSVAILANTACKDSAPKDLFHHVIVRLHRERALDLVCADCLPWTKLFRLTWQLVPREAIWIASWLVEVGQNTEIGQLCLQAMLDSEQNFSAHNQCGTNLRKTELSSQPARMHSLRCACRCACHIK